MLLKSKLFLIVIFVFHTTSVFANSKCFEILKIWVPDDGMIKVAHLKDNSLTIYINNIRNMKDIDIKGYGFDDKQAKQLEKKYSCPKTSFVKAFNRYGIPNPFKIKGKLLKDYNNQEIVLEK